MKRILVLASVIVVTITATAFADELEKPRLVAGLTNETRAGIVVVSGNSRAQTFDLSQKDSYEWNANKLGLLGSYLRSTSKGIESARRWSLGLRYDRAVADRWSAFVSQLVEGDPYAGFLQRYSSDVGGKYLLVKSDTDAWSAEAGYRFQRENQISGNIKDSSLARAYSEYEHRWNPSVSSRLWVELLQNVSTGDDRFLNGEASLKAALTNIFSVQLAYLVRYRNLLPQSVAYKTDTTFTAALLAQF